MAISRKEVEKAGNKKTQREALMLLAVALSETAATYLALLNVKVGRTSQGLLAKLRT